MNSSHYVLKNIFIKSIKYSFFTGFCVGCFPNNLTIKFNDKKFNHVPIPIIGGTISLLGVMFSPLLIMNYFSNGTFFDKIIDNLNEKYSIDVERYHQYDGKNNKYAFPSLVILNINSKDKNTYNFSKNYIL